MPPPVRPIVTLCRRTAVVARGDDRLDAAGLQVGASSVAVIGVVSDQRLDTHAVQQLIHPVQLGAVAGQQCNLHQAGPSPSTSIRAFVVGPPF